MPNVAGVERVYGGDFRRRKAMDRSAGTITLPNRGSVLAQRDAHHLRVEFGSDGEQCLFWRLERTEGSERRFGKQDVIGHWDQGAKILHGRRIRVEDRRNAKATGLRKRRTRALDPAHVAEHGAGLCDLVQRQPCRVAVERGIGERHDQPLALTVHQDRREPGAGARHASDALDGHAFPGDLVDEGLPRLVVSDARPEADGAAEPGDRDGSDGRHAGRRLHRALGQYLFALSGDAFDAEDRVPKGAADDDDAVARHLIPSHVNSGHVVCRSILHVHMALAVPGDTSWRRRTLSRLVCA